MICRNCSRLIRPCGYPTCGIGYEHVYNASHYCDDPRQPGRFAEPDPAT